MKHSGKVSSYLIVVLVLAAVSSQVAAAPAYFGYTGLMLTPTADILKTGGFGFGAVYLTGDSNDTTFLSANVGLLNTLEVGGAWVSPEHGDSSGIINAKLAVLEENAVSPGLSIGVSDITNEIDMTPYVVLSKALLLNSTNRWAPRAHIGFGGGHLDGLFAGLSATVNDRTQVMVEYDTNDVNFGVQFAAADRLRLHAGLVSGDRLGLGLSYNVGF